MARQVPPGPKLYKITKKGEVHFIDPDRWDNRATDPRMRDYDPQLEGFKRVGGLFQQDRKTTDYVEVEKAAKKRK